MKYLIASDIHGSAYYCRLLLDAYKKEGAQRLLLLGDLLYHGPRNDLPRDYAPKEVIAMLNGLRQEILCVRGNCDAEVDQMVLQFPILADYAVLAMGDTTVYATHGHVYNESCPPPLMAGDILLCGHFHIPANHSAGDFTYMNPGSVSIPKENSPHGYMLWDEGGFVWKDIESGKEYTAK